MAMCPKSFLIAVPRVHFLFRFCLRLRLYLAVLYFGLSLSFPLLLLFVRAIALFGHSLDYLTAAFHGLGIQLNV